MAEVGALNGRRREVVIIGRDAEPPRVGNAQSGALTVFYDGARPSGDNPTHKQGAIILGIGADNSNDGQGNFFEGARTSGASSDETDDAVQANVVAAR